MFSVFSLISEPTNQPVVSRSVSRSINQSSFISYTRKSTKNL